MSFRTRILPVVPFLLGGLVLAPNVKAGETTPVQCAANDDRVWVYDSLTSFSVELRLKCGAPVEVVGRAKGYVKIKTADGKEGYVPDAALPNLPPYVDPQAILADGLAGLVRSRKPAPAPNPAQPQHALASEPPATAAPTISASVVARPPAPEATAVMTIEPLPASPPAAPVANVKPVSVAPKKTPKPQPPAVRKSIPPPPPPAPATNATTASSNSPVLGKTSPQVAMLSSSPANTAPRMESAVEKGSVALPTNTSMKQPANASLRSVAAVSDSEDDPESKPEDQSADPACRVFFSAYGLAPAQYRWIAQNRQKKYPGVCPASGPSQVDYVMIFTHDVEIFNGTLPDAVHVDKNGFSDFSPLTTVDSALMPQAAADKAHHQFVWVFRIKRGAFEPTKFSPRRHPQFAKNESNSLTASHAADRTAEDAFQFIEEEGSTR